MPVSCPRVRVLRLENGTAAGKDVLPDAVPGSPLTASASSGHDVTNEIDLTQFLVPEPSGVSSAVAEAVEHLGPVTASDVGLSWWCPTGGMFKVFETLHESLPWWGTIAVATLAARVLVSPLVVHSQKNSALMSHNLPEMQEAQANFAKARRIGNQADVLKASLELQQAMQKANHSVIASMVPVLVQMPVFLSFFLTLRAMTDYPIDTMKTGGLFWFTDLTLPDPYYILPVVTSTTLFVILKLGVEYGNGAAPPGMGPQLAGIDIRTLVQYVTPVFVLIFTRNFASGILVYWCTTNIISLAQVMILKQPRVRTYLQIPETRRPDPAAVASKPKRTLTETWEEFKLSNQVEDRSRILSEQAFAQAATAPLRRTYKSDPTKVKVE